MKVNKNSDFSAAVFSQSVYDPAQIKFRTISSPSSLEAPVRTADGSQFYTDVDGVIKFAQYASGAVVNILPNFTTTRTVAGDFWIVDSSGLSYRLD